jgi:hypothetical protein
LRIDWTPGHIDIAGNEAADMAAKRVAQEGSYGGTPKVLTGLPFSKSALALTHTRLLQKAATKKLKRSARYARISQVDDTMPSAKFRKLTADLPRKHSSLLFQLRSHHALLAKHLHRLNKLPSLNCPWCGQHDETVEHFLHFCTAHEHTRRQLRASSRLAAHYKHLLSDPELLLHLFCYIQNTCWFHSVFSDFKQLEKPTK